MSLRFTTKKIRVPKLNPKAILDELKAAHQTEMERIQKELDKTVTTWEEKPRFERPTRLYGRDYLTRFSTGGKVWHYIDKGTDIRWAVMSDDWQSKTQPRRRRARRGSGNVVIAGRRAMQERNIAPRPGIDARGWSEDIPRERRKPYRRRMQKALRVGLRKAVS